MIKSDGRDEPVGLRPGRRLSLAAEPKVHRSANGTTRTNKFVRGTQSQQTSLSVAPSLNKQVCPWHPGQIEFSTSLKQSFLAYRKDTSGTETAFMSSTG
jgi:hypothetical protein